ncbi:hypothetical protein YQE_06798, partial [Dendroctonus ponderosae]
MPSIEQCDAAAVNVVALPATLEMFEKFKQTSDNGKDSDSEESFHLQLDEDFIENGSVVSNGNDKEQKCEETEDDILNKFDTAIQDTADHLDACDEDVILNDIDDDKGAEEIIEKALILSPILLPNTDIKITYGFKDYEESTDGEFKSVYEIDAKLPENDVETQEKPAESMEVVPEDINTTSNEQPTATDVSMDAEAQANPANEVKMALETPVNDDLEGDTDVNMSEPSNSSALPEQPPKCEGVSEDNADDKGLLSSPQQDANEILTKSETDAGAKSDEKDLFKIPDELSKDAQACGSEVSNDKTEDDESDLLDVSMIRETEEDDAFAIADAIEDTDKETQASEKSDEEQSERMETEQEGSDADKDNFDNDNAMGFDDGDEEGDDAESRVREPDGSGSETERKNKIAEISDSSKDSVSDSNSKLETEVKASDKNVDDKLTNEDTLSDDELPLIMRTRGLSSRSVSSTCDTNETNDIKKDAKDNEKATETCEKVAEKKTVDESGKIQSEKRKAVLNKRSNSFEDDGASKKLKLSVDVQESSETDKQLSTSSATGEPPVVGENVNTLTSFVKFMQCHKLSGKLSRSDLEQFCIQKICESLMLKSSEGELHQIIKKHEKTIENIRKDLQQLSKQCKDLEIVNKKLMGELKNQNAAKKAVMPLRITRSVGLQVRLNPGNEVANQNRRRTTIISPPKALLANHMLNNRSKTSPASIQPIRQMMQNSLQKSPLTTGQPTTPVMAPMLATALQKRAATAKRTPSSKKQAEKTGNPGVIDLTEEDDKLAQNKSHTNAMKIINNIATGNKNITTNKQSPGKNGLS